MLLLSILTTRSSKSKSHSTHDLALWSPNNSSIHRNGQTKPSKQQPGPSRNNRKETIFHFCISTHTLKTERIPRTTTTTKDDYPKKGYTYKRESISIDVQVQDLWKYEDTGKKTQSPLKIHNCLIKNPTDRSGWNSREIL